jgi:hypothetical protein
MGLCLYVISYDSEGAIYILLNNKVVWVVLMREVRRFQVVETE